jgi:uncharacterized protein
MKWTLQELIKNEKQDNTFEETVDFSDFIATTDILKISPCYVEGDYEIYDQEEFVFYIDIKVTLTLACAITLKEVEYEMDFSVEETFSTVRNDDFNYIEGITIDLLPIIWSNIILEKPMRVLHEDAYEDRGFEEDEFPEDIETDNAFSKLKDYKN